MTFYYYMPFCRDFQQNFSEVNDITPETFCYDLIFDIVPLTMHMFLGLYLPRIHRGITNRCYSLVNFFHETRLFSCQGFNNFCLFRGM